MLRVFQVSGVIGSLGQAALIAVAGVEVIELWAAPLETKVNTMADARIDNRDIGVICGFKLVCAND